MMTFLIVLLTFTFIFIIAELCYFEYQSKSFKKSLVKGKFIRINGKEYRIFSYSSSKDTISILDGYGLINKYPIKDIIDENFYPKSILTLIFKL